MNIGSRKVSVAIAVLGILCVVSMSRADTLAFDGIGLHMQVTLHAPGHLFDGQTVNDGQLLITYQNRQYKAYCVDIDHAMTATEQVSPISVLSLNRGSKVAYLFDTYAPTVTTNDAAAALQSAIWETLFETSGTLDVRSGQFSVAESTAVDTLANSYLASLPTSYLPRSSTFVLDSATGQDVIVPEPATLLLLTFGGLAILRRRRQMA